MKTSKKHFNSVTEAISIKSSKQLGLKRSRSGAYGRPILDSVFGGKDRMVYDLDVPIDDILSKNNPIVRSINVLLDIHFNAEIKTTQDYISGVAYDKADDARKSPQKIGKLLQKIALTGSLSAKSLLKTFSEDPTRAMKPKKYKVVISRHPYDVAGMSTDRNWTSCMNLGLNERITTKKDYIKGAEKQYVAGDIKEGSLIAYLVSDDDVHANGKIAIRKPYSRILMRPFFSASGDSEDVLYGIGPNKYGVESKEFVDFLTDWLKTKININIQEKLYEMPYSVYNDGDVPVGFTTKDNQIKTIQDHINLELKKIFGSKTMTDDVGTYVQVDDYVYSDKSFRVVCTLSITINTDVFFDEILSLFGGKSSMFKIPPILEDSFDMISVNKLYVSDFNIRTYTPKFLAKILVYYKLELTTKELLDVDKIWNEFNKKFDIKDFSMPKLKTSIESTIKEHIKKNTDVEAPQEIITQENAMPKFKDYYKTRYPKELN